MKAIWWSKLFQEHPASVGETYTEHLAFAVRFGGTLLLAGLACLVHGLLPWVWKTRASDTVRLLYDRLIIHSRRTQRRE